MSKLRVSSEFMYYFSLSKIIKYKIIENDTKIFVILCTRIKLQRL